MIPKVLTKSFGSTKKVVVVAFISLIIGRNLD
jgi:hypothetical protein